jgi:heptosyltransferase II
MQNTKGGVLVIQTAFLGDVVLGTALIESLYSQNGLGGIDMLVRAGNEGVLAGNPKIRSVLVWEKRPNRTSLARGIMALLPKKWQSWWQLLLLIREKEYDAVVVVQRFFSMGLLAGLSRARVRVGFNKSPARWLFTHVCKHEILTLKHGEGKTGLRHVGQKTDAPTPYLHERERNHSLLKALGIMGEPGMPALYPGKEAKDTALAFRMQKGIRRKFAVLAPASVWETKRLPAGQWVSLGMALAKEYDLILIGGKEDAELCTTIRTQILEGYPRLELGFDPEIACEVAVAAGHLNLLAAAATIAEATITYTNDSGPMHLASAVGGNVVAIYCSTVPEFGFGPLVGSGNGLAFTIEAPLALPCRPCGLHGLNTCPEGHFLCAKTITTQSLLEPLERLQVRV